MKRLFTVVLVALLFLTPLLGLRADAADPVQLPPGTDVNQLLRKYGASLPSSGVGPAAASPAQVPGAQPLGPEALEAREKAAAEQKAKQEAEHKSRLADLRKQAENLAKDGELGDADRRFLTARAADLGLTAEEADTVIREAGEHRRRLADYGSFVETFLEDGVLDAGEQTLLSEKQKAFGISGEEAERIEGAARKKGKGEPLDVLGAIRDQTPEFMTGDLKPYGFELFQSPPDAFAPAAGQSPPDSYVLGPGDKVHLTLWGRMEADYQFVVDAEGKVTVPRIGPLRLGGLTYAEARRALERKTEAITGVSAAVSVAEMRPIQVLVVGESARPGSVTLTPLSTVIQAVMASGGPTRLGSLRKVLLRRGSALLASVDLYDFLRTGEAKGDRVLQTGDVVVVTKADRKVSLAGKAKRPAVYELTGSEGLRALLDIAGGIAPDAYGGRVQVARTLQNESRIILDVALSTLKGDFPLQDGDEVRIFAVPPEVENVVALFGHVVQPGPRTYSPSMRVRDLLGSAESLKPEADLTYAVILRETGPDRGKVLVPFRPGAALDGSDPKENQELRPRDQVYVFSRYQFRRPLEAQAAGQLRTPGLYRIEAGSRVADLVRLAGGVTPEALLSKAEILRYLPDRSRESLYLDLGRALAGDLKENVELAEQDTLVVYSVWDQTVREEVVIEGEVKRPASVALTQAMTIRDLVFKAGGLTKDASLAVGHLYRTDRMTKEVTIHTFALGKALEGAPEDNLVLRDGDRVTIHSAYEFAPLQKVVLSGAANKPGEYPFATNLRVRDLVLAAGGLREEAFLGQAEVVRSETVAGEKAETRTYRFHLGSAMAGDPEANLALKPHDKVFIKKIPEWRDTESIELGGEVVFPGIYYIAKGERLSSVLRRAGGFTPEAYPPAAVFTRESARQQQQRRLDELKDRLQQAVLRASSQEVQASLTAEDVAAQKQYLASQQALLAKLERVKATGRVVLKVPPLDRLEGTEWDLALESGDALVVPKIPQTVTVVGQVYNPTSLLWEPSQRRVSHYLAKTGGPTADAEKGEIYVVRADGTVVSNSGLKNGRWWSRGIEAEELGPGDAILVPEKVLRVNYMREIRDITQILYQIAVTAGVAVALF